MKVRCVDNTLQRHVLTVGKVYDVMNTFDRDGYYQLSGIDIRFSMSRFARLCPCGTDLDKNDICPSHGRTST